MSLLISLSLKYEFNSLTVTKCPPQRKLARPFPPPKKGTQDANCVTLGKSSPFVSKLSLLKICVSLWCKPVLMCSLFTEKRWNGIWKMGSFNKVADKKPLCIPPETLRNRTWCLDSQIITTYINDLRPSTWIITLKSSPGRPWPQRAPFDLKKSTNGWDTKMKSGMTNVNHFMHNFSINCHFHP